VIPHEEVSHMLKFARNKVVSAARKDQNTLSIHGLLDDDIYGLEVDLCIGIRDLQILSVAGKWNRRTTPECPSAIPFLQEARGFHIDDEIDGRMNKIIGRKGCRHFANLLIECCHAATEAARVARWEDAKVARPDLTFQGFLNEEAGGRICGEGKSSPLARPSTPPPSAMRVEVTREGPHSPEPGPTRLDPSSDGFVIDLHVHTFPASPCSSASAEAMIEEAKRIGLNGLCLTDHNHVWSPARVEELKQKHGFPIFRGNEITTDQGDMLVFGLDRDIRGIIKLQDLRREVLAADGFLIVAHPFRGFLTFSGDQLGLTPEGAAQRPLFQHVNAIEVLNGKVTEKENRFASSVARSLGLPATGGSDAHEVAEVGAYATRFFAEIHTEAELIQALRSGDCAPVAFRREKGAPVPGHRPAEVHTS
jgi:predicted metal-dependent phosphoesterase TrpH